MSNRMMISLLLIACSSSTTATSGDGGTPGTPGSPGTPGNPGAPSTSGGSALPPGTLLYVRADTSDRDVLVARDLATNQERVITDLTGDGSSGWEIGGYSLSPDRRRIALASLYAPTKEDTATGLAAKAIWTLTTDGTGFTRLTPTFPKDAQGRKGFQYAVQDPIWSADGTRIVYDFGSYWFEGTTQRGGSFPWSVAADGSTPPTSYPTPSDCSVLHPSRNPATGDLVFVHSVCVPGQGEDGLYLYPANGGTSPKQLVASSRATGGVDVFLEKVAWFSDGSGFLFVGGTSDWDFHPGLLAYDGKAVSPLIAPPAGAIITSVAVSDDSTKIVYCLRADDNTTNLHLVDASKSPATDTAITTDGKSSYPSF